MAEFSKPGYHVDVMKVEIPVGLEFVEGAGGYRGQKAYSYSEALNHFKEASAAAAVPFVYLSAGVSNAQFVESLRMAAEAGVGTLVLSHITPGSLMDVPDSLYLEGVRKHFDGEVIIGRDLMVI